MTDYADLEIQRRQYLGNQTGRVPPGKINKPYAPIITGRL
jgi:hypothetical protein